MEVLLSFLHIYYADKCDTGQLYKNAGKIVSGGSISDIHANVSHHFRDMKHASVEITGKRVKCECLKQGIVISSHGLRWRKMEAFFFCTDKCTKVAATIGKLNRSEGRG
ncbi:hypothetical protein CEXT_68871 [Caerostris extrusa]|uniref:TRASH domain-containing protein n=1 Tax=Caerostris extrusa TaxID=172846 RepID=A0AAV4TGC0_CAEEX|nr:hypothetical protein CEXT_68871 [Caerostris extrusa]